MVHVDVKPSDFDESHQEDLSLEELAVNRTSVFVAHRLSTIQQCDRIYVLADGVVRESGSHEQLMQSNGLYYDMWQAQAQQDVVDAESKAVAAMASDDRL